MRFSEMTLLLSFAYWRRENLADWFTRHQLQPTEFPRVLVDSGAYTVFNSASAPVITVNEYSDWLIANKDVIEHAISLDVIQDARLSRKNYESLRDKGLDVIPVFHGGQSFSVLRDYQQVADGQRIAIGGLVGLSEQQKNKYLRQVLSVADGYPLHGLGVTSWKQLRDFPWRSVDSSSWTSGYRYGIMHVWDERRRTLRKIRRWNRLTHEDVRYLRWLSIDPAQFVSRSLTWQEALRAQARTWIAMTKALQVHGRATDIYLVVQQSNLKALITSKEEMHEW